MASYESTSRPKQIIFKGSTLFDKSRNSGEAHGSSGFNSMTQRAEAMDTPVIGSPNFARTQLMIQEEQKATELNYYINNSNNFANSDHDSGFADRSMRT